MISDDETEKFLINNFRKNEIEKDWYIVDIAGNQIFAPDCRRASWSDSYEVFSHPHTIPPGNLMVTVYPMSMIDVAVADEFFSQKLYSEVDRLNEILVPGVVHGNTVLADKGVGK